MASDDFRQRVLSVVRSIPSGRVLAYSDVATLCGSPRAARAVGNILRGTAGDDIPWQRVINARGAISFKGDATRATLQRRLLQGEGVTFDPSGRTDMARFRWVAEDAPRYFDSAPAEWEPPEDWHDE